MAVGIKLNPETPIPLQLPPTGVPVNATSVSEIQILFVSAVALTTGAGLTVMVNVVAVPVQVTPPLVNEGVTVIVETIGVAPVFVAVNAGIFPVPEAASPIAVLLFVQLNTVPVTPPASVIAAEVVPAHTDLLVTAVTVGLGFIVIVNVTGEPLQLPDTGCTVIVAVIGAVVVFAAVNDAMFPVPDAPRPIAVFELVQLNVVPAGPLKLMAVVAEPAQNTWLATAFTEGNGVTVIVKVTGVPVQVTPPIVFEGVTVMVPEIFELPVLVAVNAGISPVPLAPKPMAVLLLVQLKTVPLGEPVNAIAVVEAPAQTD